MNNTNWYGGAGMSYSHYLGLTQADTLKIIYHPIYKYSIGNDYHFRTQADCKIAAQIGLKINEYQEVIRDNYNGKVRDNGNIYFNSYADAEITLQWIDSMRTMQKLRTSK